MGPFEKEDEASFHDPVEPGESSSSSLVVSEALLETSSMVEPSAKAPVVKKELVEISSPAVKKELVEHSSLVEHSPRVVKKEWVESPRAKVKQELLEA